MALESVHVPEVGESVSEGTIASWFTEPGASIAAGDPLFELATEKVDSEIPSPLTGTVVEILIPKGGTVSVGDAVITIETSAAEAPAAEPPATSPAPPAAAPPAPASPARVAAPPSQQPAAPQASPGSPPLPPMPPGQVAASPARPTSQSPAAEAPKAPVATSELATPGEDDTFERFSRIRKITGRITSEANVTIPHVLSVVEADHSAVMAARSIIKARGTGAPPTALAYVAVAITRALGDHPRLNASVGDGGLVLHRSINLAFAIDTEDGLVAPVVKNADQLTVTGMAEAIVDLATRARAKKLLPADMSGGTFSISNNGSVGSVLTAPIITPPQVAVLSTDKVVDRAVVIEQDGSKAVAIRPIGNLAMSWDHRAVDGAGAARFLSQVKAILETTDWSGLG